MSRRQRRGLSPNLFPFLAVLVCTLGTLILLLALVAQKAEESAEQMVDEQTESARLIAEEERWEAEKLIEHRRQQTAELDKRRSELAHVEDHARRLREELETLKQEIEATERDDDAGAVAETQSRLVSLRRQTDREKELIRDLEKERDGKPPRVVIVPYKGANGTDRRPIYVECTSSAVIIQPEGVRITASQLDGPMGPGNPLDAALRAVRSHWQKQDPNAPPPYPLLMVRPSGIHAYGASRIAMSTWDDQFGYELIPENLELAFPVKDSVLEVKLVEAVQDAVSRSRSRIAGAPSKYSQFTPQRIASSNRSGNADGPVNGGGAENGASSGAGSFNGVGSLPGESFSGSGSGTTSGGERSGLSSPQLSGPQLNGPQLNQPQLDVAVNGSGQGVGGRGSRSGAGDFTIDGADLMLQRNSQGTGNASGEFSGELGEVSAGANRGGDAAMAAGSLAGKQAAGSAESEFYSDEEFLSGSNGAGGDSAAGAETEGQGAESQGGEGNVSGPANPLGGNGQMSSGKLAGGGAGSGSSSQAQSSSTGTAAAMADPGRPSSSFEMSEAADPHEKTFSETMQNDFGASNRGERGQASGGQTPVLGGGNNWALPDSMLNRRGTSIVREMSLQCTANGFVLMPEGGQGLPQAFPIENGLVDKSVVELATAIRKRVDRWGVAMQNGRWDPVLSVRVSPGGETRFRQLQMLMKNSGVRVEQETR